MTLQAEGRPAGWMDGQAGWGGGGRWVGGGGRRL